MLGQRMSRLSFPLIQVVESTRPQVTENVTILRELAQEFGLVLLLGLRTFKQAGLG
jgi:hypothetical protein